MTAPFIIVALPRSRTAWLAHFLRHDGRHRVGHDLAVECGSLDEFVGRLRARDGTVETGAMLGWRAIREAIPEIRMILVRRPLPEVANSLARLGTQIDRADMLRRDAMLDAASLAPGVRSIGFHELNFAGQCKWLYERCVGERLDLDWWVDTHEVNIQIDWPARLAYLRANQSRIESFKAEVSDNLPETPASPSGIVVALESWPRFWPEADGLIRQHFAEVDGGDEPRRRYQMDAQVMAEMSRCGALRLTTARRDGRLVGYISWMVSLDPESLGLLIANQGGWFVDPGLGRNRLGLDLFDRSVDDLRAMGVSNIFSHHRVNGRGADLGKFFGRRGAVKTQDTFSMWLGD